MTADDSTALNPSETPRKNLNEIISEDWAHALAPVESNIHQMGDFLREEHARGIQTTPPSKDILKAFTTPLESVKVLIVGQDPYPTPGDAMGLSFSVNPHVRPIPPSLKNIYKELESDLGIKAPSHGDLSSWFDQGVLLLNRVLTTQIRKTAAHKGKGWEKITEEAVRVLATRDQPLVVILWGRDAQNLKRIFAEAADSGADPNNVVIIESPHPSPLAAHHGFFGSRPFSRTNITLEKMGQVPIDWKLPEQK